MLLIYIVSLVIWAVILTYIVFSSKSQYVSKRIFNLLIVIAIIPVLNTLYLVSAIISVITDKRTKEERAEAFKRNCEHLDALLEAIINSFKKQ